MSGLILASALSVGLMIGCKEENSSKPTAPNIPVGPDWQTSENSNEMGFYSAKGDGQFGAFVNENSEFQISVPAGEFLLTYVANGATYYVAFRATDAAILHIGMHPGVTVSEASVQKGKITNESSKNWQSNSVTLFAWPGSSTTWKDVFQSDGSAVIVLIKNNQVAPGVNKLPEPSQPAPNPQPATNPQPQPTANPTQSPRNTSIVVEITDPDTDLGRLIIGKDESNALAIFGAKNSSGDLTSVSSIAVLSKTEAQALFSYENATNQWVLQLSDHQDIKVIFRNYDRQSASVDVTIAKEDSLGNQTVLAQVNDQSIDADLDPERIAQEMNSDIVKLKKQIFKIVCDISSFAQFLPIIGEIVRHAFCSQANDTGLDDVAIGKDICRAKDVNKVMTLGTALAVCSTSLRKSNPLPCFESVWGLIQTILGMTKKDGCQGTPSQTPWIKLTCNGAKKCTIPLGGTVTLNIQYYNPLKNSGGIKIGSGVLMPVWGIYKPIALGSSNGEINVTLKNTGPIFGTSCDSSLDYPIGADLCEGDKTMICTLAEDSIKIDVLAGGTGFNGGPCLLQEQ